MTVNQQLEARINALQAENKKLEEELKLARRGLEIESALEKVRNRALDMRTSAELAETSAVLFQQLKHLGIQAIRTGVGIFDERYEAMELWLTNTSGENEVTRILDYFSLHIHPVFENIIPARKQGLPYVVTRLQGAEVRAYYESVSTYLSREEQTLFNKEEYFYSFFFNEGALNLVSSRSLTDEECNIMNRFARVFGLIYTRFQDLQRAESQTRDALRQNSLDRVRAEIASMRSREDLQHIPPLIWRELVNLNVPFFRCGIFIVREDEQLVHAYLSNPKGESLGVLHLAFEGDPTTRALVGHWRNKSIFHEYWNREQFQAWVNSMLEQGQIQEAIQYQAGEESPPSLNLHFIPFAQGMLYVGSHDPLDELEEGLVRSLAESFSMAYSRYEDFTQLEMAKSRIEETLTELKATQSQLIQSEKMASLGELTAGIAHEIQNPLNFINNFSEINTELTEELEQELDKGHNQEARELARDIRSNQQKINHHGKRADGIVKGMLQHSRSQSGQKEETDINNLCDEYLRLAYHGLRAKDKTFQAAYQTHFDPGTGKLYVMPQDLGRVLLNLVNNAFYTVTERKREAGEGYEPMVTVSTRRIKDKVEIKVKDNGGGIPDAVKEKIFQPFFTTKPTGQGTGLGLSLSYDIITKGHGGELTLESEEGKGSEFIIRLPG